VWGSHDHEGSISFWWLQQIGKNAVAQNEIVLSLMVEVGQSWRCTSSCQGTVRSSRLTSCCIWNFQLPSIHAFTISIQEKGAWSQTAWKRLCFYLSGSMKGLVNEQWTDSLLIDHNSSDVCAGWQKQYTL